MIIICNKKKKDVIAKSSQLLEFCFKNSENIVLTRRHSGAIPAAILREMVDKELREIEERSARQIEFSKTVSKKELKRIEMKDQATLRKYFINQAREEREVALGYAQEYPDGNDSLEKNLAPHGLVKREFNLGSFFTWPGVWDICYFEKERIDCSELKLYFFTYSINVGEYEFEDFGFQNKSGLVWCKTCAHESYFEMELTQKQYEGFKKIGITHEILKSNV